MPALSFRIPLRFLRGSYSKLALTVIALACGVALVCAIDLVNRAVLRAFTEVIDTMAGRAALQVSAGGSGLFAEDVAEKVAAVPGVELAVPVVSGTAFTTDKSGDLLTVHGVDVTNEKAVRVYEARDAGGLELDDPLEFLNQADSVVLTRAFAQRKGLKVGDPIELETPTGRKTFVVRGLLEPQGIARVYGGNLVVMDLYAAEAAFTRPRFVNRVDVVVAPEADLSAVAERIRSVVPQGLKTAFPEQRKADLNRVMDSMRILLQGLGLMALVAGFLVAYNRLAAVFEARSWQVGVFRAIGVKSNRIWFELEKESLLLGIAGVILGILGGIALGKALVPVIATSAALAFNLVAPAADFGLRPSSLVVASMLGLTAAGLSAAVPAYRAARVEVIDNLRGRGMEQPELHAAGLFWVRVSCVVLLGVTVIAQGFTKSASWGLIATVLGSVATALAARPLVGLLARPLSSPLLTRNARFAAAAIVRSPRRFALMTGTLGVGVGAVIWLWIMAKSFEATVVETLSSALRADLFVSSSNVASGFVEAPLDDAVLEEIRSIRGVHAIVGERMAEWDYKGGPIAVHAFDELYFVDDQFGQPPLVGERLTDVWQKLRDGSGVLVSSNFELNVGGRVGDPIELNTPTGPLRLTIAGVTPDFISPRGTIFINRSLFSAKWGDPHVTHVFIRLEDGVSPADVQQQIASGVGARHRIRTLSSHEMIEYFAEQVRRAFASFSILTGAILVVVLVGMADTLAAGVAERTREIGVARAVGLQSRDIYVTVLIEGACVGLVGLLLAMAAGFGLGVLWVKATFPYLLGFAFELHAPMLQIVSILAVTGLVCVLAGLLPARRASKLEPVEALRYE